MRSWQPDARFYRELYVDEMRALLRRWGTQRQLAAAVGVSPAYLSGVLTHWQDPPSSMTETPTLERAAQILDVICPHAGWRQSILEHVRAAREGPRLGPTAPSGLLDSGVVEELLRRLERAHTAATFTTGPGQSRAAYAEVRALAAWAQKHLDPERDRLELVRVLLFRHDAECVLNRADLALMHSRMAVALTAEEPSTLRARDWRDWLQVNAYRAEAVALNNLGLPVSARQVSRKAQALRGYAASAGLWEPLVLGDHLSAFRRLQPPFRIGEAEALHAQARRHTADGALGAILLDHRLAGAYLAQGSPLSLRKARPLVEAGLTRVENPALGPLHRVQLLTTGARHAWLTGDREQWADTTRLALAAIDVADLRHQRAQLVEQYGAETLRGVAV